MKELRELLLGEGASLVGFADLAPVPTEIRDNMPVGISMAVALNPTIIAGIKSGPTGEYYAEMQRAKALLRTLGLSAADFLGSRGHRAIAVDALDVRTDYTTLSNPWLPHKTVATRAGLGWIGKCALLVTEGFGSAVRLGTVLTDAELDVGEPTVRSRCDDCMSCVDICRARAPSGGNWHAGMDRSAFFDAFVCHEAAKEAGRDIGVDKSICGMCISACPWTLEYIDRS